MSSSSSSPPSPLPSRPLLSLTLSPCCCQFYSFYLSNTETRLRQEVARLTQERDTLLSTELYTTDDRVINIIQKALDLQTQRLRDELLKKERVSDDSPKKQRAKIVAPKAGTSKPQKTITTTISKKPAKSKINSTHTRPK